MRRILEVCARLEEALPGVIAVRQKQIHVAQRTLGQRVVLPPSLDAVQEQQHSRTSAVDQGYELEQIQMPHQNDVRSPAVSDRPKHSTTLPRTRLVV